MKPLFFTITLLSILFSTCLNSYAAFPIQTESMPTATQQHQTFGEKVQSAIKRYTSPVAPQEAGSSADNGTTGILSFTFGVAGILTLIAGIITGGSVILLWPAFGIAAIVLGAIGLNKKNNGLAVAGFVLGLIEVTVFLAAIVLAIASISSYK